MTQAYDQLARYYDLLHLEQRADIPFLLELARTVGGPILELGCGSGRLLLPLAQAGYSVTGLDHSPAMLALARRRLAAAPRDVAQRVSLVEAEIADFALPAPDYALAFLGYNTIMHLSAGELASALARIAAHVRPSGRLLVDSLNPLGLEGAESSAAPDLERVMQDPENGEWIVVASSIEVDTAAQAARATWIFDVSPAGGGAVQRTVIPVDYTLHYPHQLEILLNESGFQLQALYGNYAREPFDEDAERLIAVASFNQIPGSS